jgi:hypothetical protein
VGFVPLEIKNGEVKWGGRCGVLIYSLTAAESTDGDEGDAKYGNPTL